MKAKIRLLSIAVVFLVGASTLSILSHQAKSATSGLVGYWKFDENSGTVAHDSSGNGNAGTLTNGPQWVSGISGMALSFDGSNDYVSIPDSSSLDISGDQISIEFWMKPTVDLPYPADNIIIFDKGNAYTACIAMGEGSNGKCLARLPFFGGVDSTTNFWASGRWYHIVITYDGSNMRIYVNGQLENTAATTGNVQPSGYPLSIGSHCLGGKNFFKGILDEFAIYNYARTAQDILNNYNSFVQISQGPFWMQWWFWAIIILGILAILLVFTALHYRKKALAKEKVISSKPASKEYIVCPNCGATLPAHSRFCGKCGTSLDADMHDKK